MFGTKCEWLLSLIEWVKLSALPLFILSTPSSETKRSVEYIMGEVMICRGGGVSGGAGAAGGGPASLKTIMISENTSFTVPNGVVNNEFSVRIFGGGGGGVWGYVPASGGMFGGSWEYQCGGGGGWMNNDILTLNPGSSVAITIGAGGSGNSTTGNANLTAGSGGTTAFGPYLSAAGGSGGSWESPGSGGSSGGGICHYEGTSYGFAFGYAYQFGIGGLYKYYKGPSSAGRRNAGPWGGGGYCWSSWSNRCDPSNGGTYGGGSADGKGGTYGGNGGENGTNTIGWTNVDKNYATNEYITGYGRCMNPGKSSYGGGGFGGNGGNSHWSGGGGYGGNGGLGNTNNNPGGGGGGGGYGPGADGGNASGGGGGYYAKGGDHGGGGGSYGPGGTESAGGSYGGGGGWGADGGKGIVIIHYYGTE